MKISRKVWDKYIQTLRRLDDKAATELTNYYVRILGEGLSDDEISRRLTNMAYALATKYGEAASAASCEMYDAVAETSDVVVPPAMPAKTATYSETAKAINRAMSFSTNENVIGAVAGRLVKMAGVDTTMQNAIRDGAEWAWVPSGDTCAFCLTLASRGWLPASEEQIKGGHAEHIHANCDCTFAIRFDKNTQVEGYDPDELKRQYYAAEGSSSKDKINYMRRQKYAANKDTINAQKRAAYAKKKEVVIAYGRERGLLRITAVPASTITEKVNSGEYSLRLTRNQYNKHVAGTADYERYENSRRKKKLGPQGRLVISYEDAQEIIEKRSGTGIIKVRKDNTPLNIEWINCERIIGQYYDKGQWHDTTKCAIHHGKMGSHIVPMKGNNFD